MRHYDHPHPLGEPMLDIIITSAFVVAIFLVIGYQIVEEIKAR